MRNNNNLATGSVVKHLLRLALPAVVAQIINLLYNMVDRIYVGASSEGTNALAGLGVCFPLLIIVSAFAALVGMGGAPIAAIKMGEKKTEQAEKIFNNGLVLLVIFGVVLTAVLLLFSKPLLTAFGSPPSSLEYGSSYMKIYAIGTIFVMISLGLNSFISTQGFSFTAMLSVAIGAVLNIALDPIFIFGLNLGVRGAAIATVISQGASCVFIICFFLSKRSMLRIKPKMFRLASKIILPMIALGISPFIMQATESAVQIVFNIQMKAYTGGNPDYTAALTIMLSVMQMIVLPLNGLGAGAQPLISYNYGAGNSARVKQTVKWLFCIAFAVCLVVWLVCLLFPQIFAKVFSANQAVTTIVKKYMPLFMMGTIFFCSQFALQSAFLALGQAGKSMILALLRKVILLIPLTFILPLFTSVSGIFIAEGIADITAGIITTLTFMISFPRILKRRDQMLMSRSNEEIVKEN